MKINDDDLVVIIEALHLAITIGFSLFGKPSDRLLEVYERLNGEKYKEE